MEGHSINSVKGYEDVSIKELALIIKNIVDNDKLIELCHQKYQRTEINNNITYARG